jgi:Tat protein secretion system quality control protein TatD with DNase activity
VDNIDPIAVLLETDGPYMAPLPEKKGAIAHPGHIPLIAEKVIMAQYYSTADRSIERSGCRCCSPSH